MIIKITPRKTSKPTAPVADLRLVFGPGPLSGLALTGFLVWRAPDGDISITFPSRAYTAGGKTKYTWYLGSEGDDDNAAVYQFRAHLVRYYKDWVANSGV